MPSGIVRAHLVQRHEMGDHEKHQSERHRGHVQREESVQRRVADHVIAADPVHQAPPITGMLPNSETMTCAPQKLMLPQGST